MIYDKSKVTTWGNIVTGDEFFGVAVRTGRKWQNCMQDSAPKLFPKRDEADEYAKTLEVSLKSRGLWKTNPSPAAKTEA